MEKRSPRFGMKLENCPTFTYRREFNDHHWLIAKPEFRENLVRGRPPKPIQTPYLIWLGLPSGFLTLLLQRAFVGIEAYVVSAAHWRIGQVGISRLMEHIEDLLNPFSLGGRGTADNYYNRVPGVVSKDLELRVTDSRLWEDTKLLYSEVRNNVFHGYEVDRDYAASVLAVYDHLADLYLWIDGWCDPDEIVPGARRALAPKPRGAA